MATATVLVVEDDKSIQTLLRETLEGEGFQVVCEKDGEWALRSLERRLPDVLITDILLPGLSGFELIEALRTLPGGAHVPVLAMSGIYRGARHKRKAEKTLGVLSYLDKPFELQTLIDALKAALGEDYPGQQPPLKPSQRRAGKNKKEKQDQEKEPAYDPLASADSEAEAAQVERATNSFRGPKTVRGNLKNRAFGEVLSQLYRWKETGGLLLKRDNLIKIIYLENGYPIFVKSNRLSECLGRVLVREKMITEAECAESVARLKRVRSKGKARQLGTVLIEMGCISPHNLVYALQLQLEAKLFDVFGWEDADYQWSSDVVIPGEPVHLDMSLATIVYEGVRRQVAQKKGFIETLHNQLAPFMDSYLGIHPDPLHRFQELSLEADERTLTALINGRSTVAQILSRTSLDDATAHALLYALMAAEMVQPLNKAQRRKDRLAPIGGPKKSGVVAAPPPLKKRTRTTPDSFAAKATVVNSEPVLPPSTIDELPVAELRKRLATRARGLRKMTFFEMLGVSKEANGEEIRRAYFSLVREIHPDKLRGSAPADARALAEQIHLQLTLAFDTLSDRQRRERYQEELAQGMRTAMGDDVGRILAAEACFHKGERALAAEDYQEATAQFREAVDLYPDEGAFYIHLGWALFQVDTESKEALEQVNTGLERNPRSDVGHLFLGRILGARGQQSEAVAQFEQAIQCNPDCKEALQELQLLGR